MKKNKQHFYADLIACGFIFLLFAAVIFGTKNIETGQTLYQQNKAFAIFLFIFVFIVFLVGILKKEDDEF